MNNQTSKDTNQPLAYVRGYAEFYKLKFKITPDVLIPRPETELLVDEVLKFNPKTMIDLGTGSGCIAISVAKNLPSVKIIAIDISEKALEIAKLNAKYNHVEKQIVFAQNDLLSNFKKAPDIIAANLPYIPSKRIPQLDESVIDFEPHLALDGGYDGFALYRKMFDQIVQQKLFPKIIVAEIDDTHRDIARYEAQHYFPQAKVEIKQDLTKRDRLLQVEFPKLIGLAPQIKLH